MMNLEEDFKSGPIVGQHDKPESGQNNDGRDDYPAGGDKSQIFSTRADDPTARDIFSNLEDCPDNDLGTSTANGASENSYGFENIPVLLDQNIAEPETAQNTSLYTATTPPTPTNTLNNTEATDAKGNIHDGGTNGMSANMYRIRSDDGSRIEEEVEGMANGRRAGWTRLNMRICFQGAS